MASMFGSSLDLLSVAHGIVSFAVAILASTTSSRPAASAIWPPQRHSIWKGLIFQQVQIEVVPTRPLPQMAKMFMMK
jgi:hypothetical protein